MVRKAARPAAGNGAPGRRASTAADGGKSGVPVVARDGAGRVDRARAEYATVAGLRGADPIETPPVCRTGWVWGLCSFLVGVWAEENSRPALFDALRRRETFGTSGPRITVRFFGGFDLPDGLCSDPRLVEKGYQNGVPMGGTFGGKAAQAPRFVVQALRDPGDGTRPGTPLQVIQIVKGTLTAQGPITKVFDVAGSRANGASVDPTSCVQKGEGADLLCGSFRDPEFDPKQPAYYYVRVLENPSCRWNTLLCNALPAAQRPAPCLDASVPKTIQERAWASPIYYIPG